MGAMHGNLPKNTQTLNQIWMQTPMIKEKDQQQHNGFITESPFSFKNPIFFSVPRDDNNKKVQLLQSKRQLFGKKEPKIPAKKLPFMQSERSQVSNQEPVAANNDFARFVK